MTNFSCLFGWTFDQCLMKQMEFYFEINRVFSSPYGQVKVGRKALLVGDLEIHSVRLQKKNTLILPRERKLFNHLCY